MEAAVNSGNALKLAEGLKKPSQSPAAVVLGAPPGKEMNRIVSSADPRAAAKDLVQKLSSDQTERALPAMRRAAVDWLMDASSSRTVLDSGENPVILGNKLNSALNDPATMGALGEILTPDQIARLKTVRNSALRVQTAQRADASEGVLNDFEGMVSEAIRRVLAAGLGRNVGRQAGMGGTVQIPGQFVKFSDRLRDAGLDPARKLVIDAVMSEDDKLLKSLLLLPEGKPLSRMATDQINAWVYATAYQYGLPLDSDESGHQGEISPQP